MSLNWPSVEGEIVYSAVIVPSGRSKRYRWYWHVEYRHAVDRQPHTGRRTHFGSTVPLSVARNIVRKFPVQSRVTVYYDPLRHAKSVLIPG